MLRKSKTQEFQFDFLPTQKIQEQRQTYRESKQIALLKLQEDPTRQSRLSDTFRDLEQQLSYIPQVNFDVVDVIKDEISILKQQKQILQDKLQGFVVEQNRLNALILQLTQNDRKKSLQIQQLEVQRQRLSKLLQLSDDTIQIDKQSLENQRRLYEMSREIESYKKRVSQFQDDVQTQLKKQLSLERVSDGRKNQIDALKDEIKGLKEALLSLKNEMHHYNVIIANKKALLLAIQAEFKPYMQVREDQLAQNVKGLFESLKNLKQEIQRKSQSIDMIERIIKASRLDHKQNADVC